MVEVIAKRTTPLCYLPSGKLVCYKDGRLVIYSGKTIVEKHCIFNSFKERILGRSKILYRFLRLGIRASLAIDESRILLSVGNTIYEYDLNNRELSDGFCLNDRIRPLAFTEVSGLEGFKDGVVFGGYLYNMERNPVSIYRRRGKDDWEIVHTFHKGELNHIHNIIVDREDKCLWVFTGDFDNSSAIWKVTNDFRNVVRFVGGDQIYRGCVAFTNKDKLLYATDAPFTTNSILMLNKQDKTINEVQKIAGSCVYGCQCGNTYVLSSTVEGDARSQNLFQAIFNRKRGMGIVDDYVHLYISCDELTYNDVYKIKKDSWPFSFQLGAFRFPAGMGKLSVVFFQPIATKHNDLSLMCINV